MEINYLLFTCLQRFCARRWFLNFPSQKNYTPLHLAALSKKHLVAQLLIGYGADVTVIGGLVRLILFVCLFVCLLFLRNFLWDFSFECALVKMINFDWAVRFQGMVTKTESKDGGRFEWTIGKQTRLWVSLDQLQKPKFGKTFCTLKKRFKKHLKKRKEKFTELKRYGELCKR